AGNAAGGIQLMGPAERLVRGVNPLLAARARGGRARLHVAPRPGRTRLAVVRHPGVLQAAADQLPPVHADQVVVLANAGPRDTDGTVVYDVAAADRAAREQLGREPLWAPIGPLVRQEIADLVPAERLMAEDWVNVIDVAAWARPRTGWAGEIGRASCRGSVERRG